MRALLLALLVNTPAFAQNIGDIRFDSLTDDPQFRLCDSTWIWQGYWLKTNVDETSLTVARELRSKFNPRDEWKSESGIIRIRFLVNCQGQTDRFRLLELDFDLNEKKFSESLRNHVLTIARQISWPVRRAPQEQKAVDYYHYFSIRITNGQLTDIIQ